MNILLPNFANEQEKLAIKEYLLTMNKKIIQEKSKKYSFDFSNGLPSELPTSTQTPVEASPVKSCKRTKRFRRKVKKVGVRYLISDQ